MYYFGTSLTSAGHYFFNLTSKSEYMHTADYKEMDFNKIPFNPEKLPIREKEYSYPPVGTTGFYHFGEYSVFAVEGSCTDKRPNSKSVFFLRDNLTKEQFIEEMKAIPMVMKIINQLPCKLEGLTTNP